MIPLLVQLVWVSGQAVQRLTTFKTV
jgi:hypothetical protein